MQEVKSKKLVYLVAFSFVAIFLGTGTWYWKSQKQLRPDQKYAIVKVEKNDIRIIVQATGTVQPENRLVIKAPINGRIEKVGIEEGVKVNRGQTLALMSSVDRAALMDVARSKGPEELKHWEDVYRPTPIVAPMAGLIIARNVEPGQTITAQDAIFVMSDQLTVVAQVDETDIAKITLNQPVSIVLDAYSNQKIFGKVHHIAFEAKTVNNVTVYDVQVLPDEVPAFMRSGMTASVKFLISEKVQILTLPNSAIKREKGKATVLLASTDWEKGAPPDVKEVKTGLTDGRLTEITEGLQLNDVVLQENLRLPESKSGGNPFSPMGGGNRRNSGGGPPRPPAHP